MVTVLRVLRLLFAVVGVWQIIGLVPVFTWFANPNAVTLGMAGVVVFKIFVALICAAIYYWLRHVQQRHQLTSSPTQPVQLGSSNPTPVLVRNDAAEILSPATDGAPTMKAKVDTTFTAGSTDDIYAKIADELKSGATDMGLWTRLFAESNGDEKQTKVRYIKSRAALLLAERRPEQNAYEAQAARGRHITQSEAKAHAQSEAAAPDRAAQWNTNRRHMLELCAQVRRGHLDVHAYAFLAEQVGASFEWENSIFSSCYTFTKGRSITQFRTFSLIRPWYIENVVPQIEANA